MFEGIGSGGMVELRVRIGIESWGGIEFLIRRQFLIGIGIAVGSLFDSRLLIVIAPGFGAADGGATRAGSWSKRAEEFVGLHAFKGIWFS